MADQERAAQTLQLMVAKDREKDITDLLELYPALGQMRIAGRTFLHASVERCHWPTIRILLKHGADLEALDSNGRTALQIAVRGGHSDVCDLLLQFGAVPDPFTAAQLGLLEALSAHLDEQPGLVRTRNEWGDTLLHTAASTGQDAAVTLLVERGADVDARDAAGAAPIFKAANAGRRETVELLRLLGAKLPLSAAAAIGDSEAAAALLDSAPELVFLVDSFLRTPLFYAVRHGQIEMARLLVRYGGEVTVQDSIGWTPLHQAVQSEQSEVALWLIDSGASVDVPDVQGRTPLHLAAEQGKTEMLRLLLKRGADPNRSDGPPPAKARVIDEVEIDVHTRVVRSPFVLSAAPPGRTALHRAVERGFGPAIEVLLAAGADINARDRFGLTPLHLAAITGNLEVARQLWEHGADVSSRGGFEQTPAEMAHERGSFHPSALQASDPEERRQYEVYDSITRLLRRPYEPGQEAP